MKHELDLGRLFKLRLIIARFGELDLAKWWNTRGQLGPLGTASVRRGLPRTHRFAQARSVFAVAEARCSEIFSAPRSVTLWRLPEDVEEQFDLHWEHWLDQADEWTPFFEKIERLNANGLLEVFRSLEVLTDEELEAYPRLKRSSEGRTVLLPGTFAATNSVIALLALGFARGEPGAPAVPYATLVG